MVRTTTASMDSPPFDRLQATLDLLRSRDTQALRSALERQLASDGLTAFVEGTLADLVFEVGEAWQRGDIQVFEEHFFSETVRGVLEVATAPRAAPAGARRAVLTTLPGELHTLGLAMVHALFADAGMDCIVLGAQTPLRDVAEAVRAYDAGLVGLSFSVEYPAELVSSSVSVLRTMLPPATEIWLGGAGAGRATGLPPGVRVFDSAADATRALLQAAR